MASAQSATDSQFRASETMVELVAQPRDDSYRTTSDRHRGRSQMKELRAPIVALLTAALLLLVICGWLFVWNDDGGGLLPVVMIIGAAQSLVLYGLVVVALTTVVMMRRRPRLAWLATSTCALAALCVWGVRHALLSDAANVNSYRGVEGSGGISSPITRAVNGQLTEVDGNALSAAWAIAVVLLVAAGVLLVAQIRRQRRTVAADAAT